jgi:CHAD domain-containing protein
MANPLYLPDVSFREAARISLSSAFTKMMDNEPGTLAGLEQSEPTEEGIEFLHDMRVGSRRLRAALSVFGAVFGKDERREWDSEVGRITDALGIVRELDVQIAELRDMQAHLPANEAYGIGRLIARQTKRRDVERLHALRALYRWEQKGFAARFTAALQDAVEQTPLTNTQEGQG